jgi:5-hydroxyisourate hydrolase-like protein (transthyretin family)
MSMQGTPVEHAEVEVKLMKGDKPRTFWKLHTHEDGIARTPAEMQIPQGTIVVEVTAAEFAPFSQTFEVHEERKTIEVKLTSGMTKLNVHVTSQGGKPIDHADVVVKFVSGHSAILLGKAIRTSWEMRTNQEGIAKVPEVPQGTILIQVIATGYQTFGQTFEVNELEKTLDVKLNSPQEQYSAH